MKSIILSCLISISCFASAETLISADANAGKALVEKNCVSCHAESFGGDGSGIYTRELRKVKNLKELVAQIRSCHTMIGLKWFEDEELNVAKYLNQSYYKFTE
ncbi:MAG: cytochrome c [Methylotenera sp.]|uniref:c-type cytochrome n=1 Tax=Methylotenera sp. TaxID=2051956 RepID=UPI002489CDEA|nr:c-type cytochrome [Methylotenera sp.]MDI1309556.1 cytochrome c [Methylotenera sp.]